MKTASAKAFGGGVEHLLATGQGSVGGDVGGVEGGTHGGAMLLGGTALAQEPDCRCWADVPVGSWVVADPSRTPPPSTL